LEGLKLVAGVGSFAVVVAVLVQKTIAGISKSRKYVRFNIIEAHFDYDLSREILM
jgi:hypothetical protein